MCPYTPCRVIIPPWGQLLHQQCVALNVWIRLHCSYAYIPHLMSVSRSFLLRYHYSTDISFIIWFCIVFLSKFLKRFSNKILRLADRGSFGKLGESTQFVNSTQTTCNSRSVRKIFLLKYLITKEISLWKAILHTKLRPKSIAKKELSPRRMCVMYCIFTNDIFEFFTSITLRRTMEMFGKAVHLDRS